jgi:hypothetical protein
MIERKFEPKQRRGTHRLTLWMYFRLTSSFKTCATESDEIFSRAERA